MSEPRTAAGRERTYLDVPYPEREEAKAGGARWDPRARRWYDPHPPTPALARWAARPDVPRVLPGEDRTFGDGLFVDLVPESCWFTNVRSCLSVTDWERLRRPILARAGNCCEICGDPEDRAARRWLDVHERWSYDEHTGVQTLRRLLAVCQPCHEVTHFGLANVRGRTAEAFAHLRRVTGMDHDQAVAHVQEAEQVWMRRSSRVWELDLSMLTHVGVTVERPPSADERAGHVEHELRQARADHPAPAMPEVPQPRPPTDSTPAPSTAARTRAPAADPNVALAAALHGTGWHGGADDLSRNAPGIGITYEAARRRQTEGADRSWRVGADGEATVAELLAPLTIPSRLDRLRRRPPAWRVLHSVPIGSGRGDIDHVLIGPPGVVTINTKHHRAGRLSLDGDELIVNGHRTDYIPKARREAARAADLLTTALTAVGRPELAARLIVRPVLAIVGGRVLITRWAAGVSVVMGRQLTHTLTSMPAVLDPDKVERIYGVARHRDAWTRP